ncbi:hypothetical protein FIU88_04825 [Halomonas sp. THAF12]|uniref:DUF5677 domain-containing protein n=1 Tax=Halomonas sp. THAF12 TaxID=2587849 RepID=UPI0012695CF0|nr:DUF5677 domain-containing protein [Halomonas sp. THAF12]QFT84298.1 hypothetical protein FIU88_04825 [Halomonas sp. THAF12]
MEGFYEFGSLHAMMKKEYGEDFISEVGEDAFLEAVEEFSITLSEKYLHYSKEYYGEALRQRSEFGERVVKKWREVFEKFEGYIELCFEIVVYYSKANKDSAEEEGSFQFRALKQLHAKSILVAREIQALLESGYADGAFARWRTLHEIGTACVVISRNSDAAERFILHESVMNYKRAINYNEFHERLNHDPIPESDIEKLKVLRDEAAKVLGENCERQSDYEWARPVFKEEGWPKKTRITFAKLEKVAGLEHYRPYYEWACEKNHAPSKENFANLGLGKFYGHESYLVGQSSHGMVEPINCTCLSLVNVVSSCLVEFSDTDSIVMINVLTKYADSLSQLALEISCSEKYADID